MPNGKVIIHCQEYSKENQPKQILYCDEKGFPLGWWTKLFWSKKFKLEVDLAISANPSAHLLPIVDGGRTYYVCRLLESNSTIGLVNSLEHSLNELYEHLEEDHMLDMEFETVPLDGSFGLDYEDNLKGVYGEFVIDSNLTLNVLKW